MVLIYLPVISAVLAIIVGILILIWPKMLNYGIALYLIVIGILQIVSQYV